MVRYISLLASSSAICPCRHSSSTFHHVDMAACPLYCFCAIPAEFRDHKDLTDPEKIQFRVGLALHGLKTMHKYVNMNEDDEGNLQVTLEQDPLGEAAFRKR